ncbi:hypothetical protein OROMI_016357 [Orobanche minor]
MGLNLQTDNSNNNTELHDDPNIRTLSKEADSVKSFVDKNCENIQTEVIPSLKAQSPVDSLNDFPSAFMLDEELELEQNTAMDPFTMERVDDEDDEIRVDDQAVERLVIVTQNNRMGEAPGEKSETMSSELASAINDGIYFYEKELNVKRSHLIQNNLLTESREENSSCSANDASLSKSRIFDHSTAGSSCEGPGHSNSRRKPNKGSSKPHSIHRQRLFPGNFRTHGSQNSFKVISESPPSDAVGFFFGSTPPDSHGVRPSKLSASPCRNLLGSSPPVGSASKSFQVFQHPSHKLLEENGFKQQL